VDFLEIDGAEQRLINFHPRFPINVPRRYAEKMPKGLIEHPITLQFLPLLEEAQVKPGWLADPVCDTEFQHTERLLQKYHGRALLVTTGACMVHCRYCFRQNYDYPSRSNFESELTLIRSDTSLREVILSGGDPLSLSDHHLLELVEALDSIPHLKRLRIHSRFPIGIPERLHDGLLHAIGKLRLQTWLVVHANHALEIDQDVAHALRRCLRVGIPVLNQAVLLRNVNDSLESQVALCERLVDIGVQPYYLHQMDRVAGAHRFEVPVEHGLQLIEQMRARLSGYAMPQYVQEVPGEPSKSPLALESQLSHTL